MALRVAEGEEDEAANKLRKLSTDQQWRRDWSIKRIERIHIGATRRELGEFAPLDQCEYNFIVTVKAADQPTMVKEALPTISRAVGHHHRGRHHHRGGHVLIGADEQNGAS